MNNDKEINCDILIIGGGFGGLWAAIKAAESGASNILIVDKGFVGKTSMSKFAAGAMICVLPEDLKENETLNTNHPIVNEFIKGTQGFIEIEHLVSLLKNNYDRVKDLEKYGIQFQKDLRGNYVRMQSRGLNNVKYIFRPLFKDKNIYGGEALVSALLKQAKKLGVKVLNKLFITNLLKSIGGTRIAGALGLNRISGEFYIFKAKAVILAASNNSFRGNYACTQATMGSSYQLAYEVGAQLRNMEFAFINTGSPKYGFEGTGPVCQVGAVFRNKEHKAFMKNYYPKVQDKADLAELIRAMSSEVKNGRGPPIYLDFSKVPVPMRNIGEFIGGWMKLHLERLKESGVDLFIGENEWVPTMQNMLGGLVTDINSESSISGLFAAGDCQSMAVGGFNGISSAHCVWSGTQAGIASAKYIEKIDCISTDEKEIAKLKKNFYNPLKRTQGIDPEDLIFQIQEIIFPYDVLIIKSETRLKMALEKILKLKNEQFYQIRAKDIHELIKTKEVENVLLSAELYLRAALLRTESRKDHFREDYPNQDDENWLKWIVVRKNIHANQPELYTKNIEM